METLSLQAFGLDKKNISIPDQDKPHYDLRIGEPKLSAFPVELLGEMGSVSNINSYYPSHGDFQLREMILARYYTGFSLETIAITNGSLGALDFIMRAHLIEGGEVLVPNPGFPPYARLVELAGGRTVYYKVLLDDEKNLIDWKKLDLLVTDETKILLLNSPHNPTGRIFTLDDFHQFKKFLKKHKHVHFLLDEVYRDLIFGNKTHYDFSPFTERGFIIGSFSKVYPLQGARIGWVFTSNKEMIKLSPYFNNIAGAVSSFGQELAKSLLKRNMDYTHAYAGALYLTKKILNSYHVDYITPEGTLFICVRYQKNAIKVADELEHLGVSAVAGDYFGSELSGGIRLSFAQKSDVLKSALSIVGRHWRQSYRDSLEWNDKGGE